MLKDILHQHLFPPPYLLHMCIHYLQSYINKEGGEKKTSEKVIFYSCSSALIARIANAAGWRRDTH